MVGYIVAGGIALTSLYAFLVSKKRHAKRILQEKESLIGLLGQVLMYTNDFTLLTQRDSYLSGFAVFTFKSKYETLYEAVRQAKYRHLPKYEDEIKSFDNFLVAYDSIGTTLKERNTSFVHAELLACSATVDDVEGRALDSQQRLAVVTDEDNNLIIAGAGSGKTTTIAGKVKYLVERQNISPSEILLISFTRKSADEMSERISKKMGISLPVKTFHKLGLDIIAEACNEKPSVFSLSQKEHLELMASLIADARSNAGYLHKLLDFITYHLRPYKQIHAFQSDAEHNNYLREQKLEGYKMVSQTLANGQQVSYRERFKSQEEVLIANFLFRNNIAYKYEEKYQYKTASKKFGQYKPDFYLPDYNIYIEHFGIDENGKVPLWFRGSEEKTAQQRYDEGIAWKRSEHLFNGTQLVESYSWEQGQGVLLENLERKLRAAGVVFEPMPEEEFYDYLMANTPEEIDTFTQLCMTFLSLFKSNNERVGHLSARATAQKDIRAQLFLDVFGPVYEGYELYLREKSEIDFSDMINSATQLISQGRFQSLYRYIIIDEFQDISQSRYQLIKALLDQQPGTRLFCVGDDWQSIYRFAGSDIGIFTGFADYFKTSPLPGFERTTSTGYIEKTYRFNNKLIELSGNFILKNPNQLRKSLKSNTLSEEAVSTIERYQNTDRNGAQAYEGLCRCLTDIGGRKGDGNVSVLLLGRYDFDRKPLEAGSSITGRYNREEGRYEYFYEGRKDLQINFMTVHSSKGLEADYVILLNGNAGTFGFPSEISDDPLLSFLLSKADQFPNGEERRLFYVALTRAKKHVYLLASQESPSKFITELEANEQVTDLGCEWCDNGKLIERKGPYGYFYACNNSHYCNFTRKIEAKELFSRGVKAYNTQDYDKALSCFGSVVQSDAAYPGVLYHIGRCHSSLKEYEKALEYYEKAATMGDAAIGVTFYKGVAHFYLAQYDIAIAELQKVEQANPKFDMLHYFLSVAYFRKSHLIKALSHLEKELEANPAGKQAVKLKEEYAEAIRKKFAKEVRIVAGDVSTISGYVKLAIEHQLNIKFNYSKSAQFDGGVQSLRTIRPEELKMVGNSLCVGGHCYMRNESRTFTVARIENLVLNPKAIEFRSDN